MMTRLPNNVIPFPKKSDAPNRPNHNASQASGAMPTRSANSDRMLTASVSLPDRFMVSSTSTGKMASIPAETSSPFSSGPFSPVPAEKKGASCESSHPLRGGKGQTLLAGSVFFRGGNRLPDADFERWRDILTKHVRRDLEQFKSPSNFETTADGKGVKVPQDYIDLPRFMRGANEGGTGQGQGKPGDEVGEVGQDGKPQQADGKPGSGKPSGPPQPGDGDPGEMGDEPGVGDQAGEGSGDTTLENWLPPVSLSGIARAIGKDLELPNFRERGSGQIQKIEEVWDNLSRQGTPGNVNRRKTFLENLKIQMSEQGKAFNPDMVQWRKDGFRFYNTSEKPMPKENAVIIYILDTSGSMSDNRKKMARDTNFYLSTYIKARYGEMNARLRNEVPTDKDFGNGVNEEFIIHDDDAEILEDDAKGSKHAKFYTSSRNGGTRFVPALKLVEKLIREKYPLDQWNVYVFHSTDGDTAGDDREAAQLLRGLVDQGLNLYGYIQTEGGHNSEFQQALQSTFKDKQNFVRRVVLDDDSSEECKKGVHVMLGKESARKTDS